MTDGLDLLAGRRKRQPPPSQHQRPLQTPEMLAPITNDHIKERPSPPATDLQVMELHLDAELVQWLKQVRGQALLFGTEVSTSAIVRHAVRRLKEQHEPGQVAEAVIAATPPVQLGRRGRPRRG